MATSTAALAMNPSTTMTRWSAAACNIAPTIVAISKPPNADRALNGSLASGCLLNTARKISIFLVTPVAFRPVPESVQAAMSNCIKRLIKSAAADVLPIPISPNSNTLPGRLMSNSLPLHRA